MVLKHSALPHPFKNFLWALPVGVALNQLDMDTAASFALCILTSNNYALYISLHLWQKQTNEQNAFLKMNDERYLKIAHYK